MSAVDPVRRRAAAGPSKKTFRRGDDPMIDVAQTASTARSRPRTLLGIAAARQVGHRATSLINDGPETVTKARDDEPASSSGPLKKTTSRNDEQSMAGPRVETKKRDDDPASALSGPRTETRSRDDDPLMR